MTCKATVATVKSFRLSETALFALRIVNTGFVFGIKIFLELLIGSETTAYCLAPLAAVHCVAAVVTTFAIGNAVSQSMPKEGNYDYISCWSGTSNDIQFSKTHGFGGLEFVVNNRTSPPGGPSDMTVARCIGLYTAFEGEFDSSLFCQAVDKDSDKFIIRNSMEGGKPKQEGFAGTGKYEGMTRIGTSQTLW